jgi:zinc protease
MTELNWTEVDHVTTVWTDAPPPLRAGLLFRTGRADETLAMAGLNHLVEHLALSAVNDPVQRNDGFVGGVMTGFVTIGQAQEVSSFLASVCEALTSLPGNRIEGEKKILEAENAARPYDFRSNLLIWRYGATGYGMLGMPQLGLRRATIEELNNFSAQRFTKENAVLWLSGPPPTDLRLNLLHGIKQPIPTLVPIQPTFPCWFVDDACGGVAAGATVPRVSASSVFRQLADTHLRERLRKVQAVSYAPRVFYDYLTADTAHLVLYADSDKDHRAELASAFGEVFEGLGKVDVAEIEIARQQVHEQWTGALAPPPEYRIAMEVQGAAVNWIFGKEYESTDALVAEMLSVTASDVSKFVRDVQATAMFALPGKAARQPWIGKPAPLATGPAVLGRETRSIYASVQRERLVYGPGGVSVVWPDGSHRTVRYSELAAAPYYEDGCVCLIGSDATTITVEPTLWRNGQSICRKIREHVPANLLLAQGSRSADAIPGPRTTTAGQRFRTLLTRR